MARPPKPKLSTQSIADTALKLVDAHGEFTLPQLAKELSVSASSLYNHVQGKTEIIELMRGQAMSAISLAHVDSSSWQEAVRQIATSYWESYSKHPKLIPLLTSHTVRDRTALQVYDALAKVLEQAGFNPSSLLHAITIIDSFVLGSALDAAAPSVVWEADEESSHAFQEALNDGLRDPHRSEKSFLIGLKVVLAGLESLLLHHTDGHSVRT